MVLATEGKYAGESSFEVLMKTKYCSSYFGCKMKLRQGDPILYINLTSLNEDSHSLKQRGG